MPAFAGIRWTRPPAELAVAIERYGDRALQAVAAVAQYAATQMQNDAKAQAAWTDRTGNARTGIFGTSEAEFGAKVVTATYLIDPDGRVRYRGAIADRQTGEQRTLHAVRAAQSLIEGKEIAEPKIAPFG